MAATKARRMQPTSTSSRDSAGILAGAIHSHTQDEALLHGWRNRDADLRSHESPPPLPVGIRDFLRRALAIVAARRMLPRIP
jgi:hypothetical protein